MALTNKLTNIGNAIRERLSEDVQYKLEDMPDKIRSIGGTGIDVWVRPEEWPNLDSLDLSDYEDVAYFTFHVIEGEVNPLGISLASTKAGQCKVDQGTVINGEFVIEKTIGTYSTSTNSQSTSRRLIIESQYEYPVIRIAPVDDTQFTMVGAKNITLNGTQIPSYAYNILETVIKGTNFTSIFSARLFTRKTRKVTFYNLGTNVPSLGNVFGGCRQLEKLDFINCDLSAVTAYNNAFEYCHNLKYGNFMDAFDFTSATNVNKMFLECLGITTLDFSTKEFNSAITTLSGMCQNMYNLKVFKFPKGDGITSITNTISNCPSLETVDMSKLSGPSLTSVDAFFTPSGTVQLPNLKNFTICDGIQVTIDLISFQTLTREQMLYVFDSLAEIAEGTTKPTIKLNTLASASLSDEDKAIVTDKGWTLTYASPSK